eukprot:sb/3467411/
MARYEIETGLWHTETSSGPSDRNGHTLTAYKEWLIMFGGQKNYKVSNELWKFNTLTREWHQLNPTSAPRKACMGHCSVLINSTIYYMGGIGTDGVTLFDIQEYNIETDTWQVTDHRSMVRTDRVETLHAHQLFHGRYGASCIYNPVTDRILVVGGMNSTSMIKEGLDNAFWRFVLMEYDPFLKHWGTLYNPWQNGVPQIYLAGVALMHDRNLLMFGGKIALPDMGDKCFNSKTYLLNTETSKTMEIRGPSSYLPHVGSVRMGHGVFTYKDAVYFVGGYTGRIRDDIVVYHFGKSWV